jgi:hypothetical protein
VIEVLDQGNRYRGEKGDGNVNPRSWYCPASRADQKKEKKQKINDLLTQREKTNPA